MPLSNAEIDDTRKRMRVMEALIKKAEDAADFLELKSIVVDLCRVVNAEVEAGHSAHFD
ncbi:hypothetical protein [Mesorhizobium sp. M0767]|uniref:hypothetical protein n=1 Tax=Mesorhizobium sp. M0767 TaxID=2956995 RepID=UPI00333B332E